MSILFIIVKVKQKKVVKFKLKSEKQASVYINTPISSH